MSAMTQQIRAEREHTPDCEVYYDGKKAEIRDLPSGYVLATVRGPEVLDAISRLGNDARAYRLRIANAELLTMARLVVANVVVSGSLFSQDYVSRSALDALRAAIAKAEGDA